MLRFGLEIQDVLAVHGITTCCMFVQQLKYVQQDISRQLNKEC